jgi:hypothetical protein
LDNNSPNIKKGMITGVRQRTIILMGEIRKSENIKKWLKERLIGCWYGYYKTYPWVMKIYEINLWFAGGTTSVVQQQQQGSTNRASIVGRWSAPILSS